jgi:hypothetical protein
MITIFTRERSSTGSNDCFVVVLVVLVGIIYPLVIKSLKVFLCRAVAHFVPSCGTFCAVLSCGTFCPFSRGFMNERIFSLVKDIEN